MTRTKDYDRTKVPEPKTTYSAVKKKCLDCVGGERPRIKTCPIKDCRLWPHRFGTGPATAKKKGRDVGGSSKRLTMKDLRRECVWCMGGGTEANKDVRECKDTDCGLYPFRMGHKQLSDPGFLCQKRLVEDILEQKNASRARIEDSPRVSIELTKGGLNR